MLHGQAKSRSGQMSETDRKPLASIMGRVRLARAGVPLFFSANFKKSQILHLFVGKRGEMEKTR